MEDSKVLKHIEDLIAEEDRLYSESNLSDSDVTRLHKIKTELDQYWDFLRQRRALRDGGRNPGSAKLRGEDIVENYEQ